MLDSVAWRRLLVTGLAPHSLSAGAAKLLLGMGLTWMLWPMLERWDTYGFLDWDLTSAHRYITRMSLRDFGELPFWNPWMCGGFPAFGFAEGAANLISPYLPFYLLFDVRTALRLEVIGSTAVAAAGAYCFAKRFTRSSALAACAAALFAFNGRWAFQLAAGHAWHLQFCWLPWAFFAFDRAQDNGRGRNAILAGVFVALSALLGGTYPFPYMVLCLTGYALLLAVQRASLRPLGTLIVVGAVSAGLAAPKLLLVADTMVSAPRLIESREVIGLAELVVMLTARNQRFGSYPLPVPDHGWHEWGIYIGYAPLIALALGTLFARGRRENALRVLGLGTLVLGFGAFHPYAPWSLLRGLPVFSSLHVPSRVHIVMVLFLSMAFVSWVAVPIDRVLQRAPWLDLLMLLPVALLIFDLVDQAQPSAKESFRFEAQDEIESAPMFEHHMSSAVHYRQGDSAMPALLSMFANRGVIDCYGIPASYTFGAIGVEDPRYRGMAEVIGGPGRAAVVEWSPNHAVVRVHGAAEGASVVYNMNYDPSWLADGKPAEKHGNRVLSRLRPGATTVVFRYWPRRLWIGLLVGLGTLGAIATWLWRRHR